MRVVRFFRLHHWGVQLPIFWGAAGALYFVMDPAPPHFWAAIGWITLVQAPLLAGVYTANDFFDWDQDADSRRIDRAGRSSRLAAAGVTIIGALLLGKLLLPSPIALGIFAVQAVFGVLYSMPPVRLKERGAAGVLCAAALQRIPPFLALGAVTGAAGGPILLLSVWLLLVGLLFILEHQVQDLDSDRAAGVSTFMLALSKESRSLLIRRTYWLFLWSGVAVPLLLLVAAPRGRTLVSAALVLALSAVLDRILRRYYAANQAIRDSRPGGVLWQLGRIGTRNPG